MDSGKAWGEGEDAEKWWEWSGVPVVEPVDGEEFTELTSEKSRDADGDEESMRTHGPGHSRFRATESCKNGDFW